MIKTEKTFFLTALSQDSWVSSRQLSAWEYRTSCPHFLLYCREHLKYVWNVHCVITNHRRDPYTTEITDNERFPICHRTNYFRFVLTFSFLFSHVSNCFSFLFVYSMCYKSEEYIQLWTIFGNKLQSRCAGPTRRFGERIFKLFVTIEIVSYAWSQVTMKVSRYSFLISIASRLLQHVIPQISNA